MTDPRSTSDRGYGYAHQQERKRWEPLVSAGRAYCWRCGEWLDPDQPWDLGHDDEDRTVYRGPECRPCNRATKGRSKAALRRWKL